MMYYEEKPKSTMLECQPQIKPKKINWKERRMHHFFLTRVMRGCFRRLTGEIVDGELFVDKDVEQHKQGIDVISE